MAFVAALSDRDPRQRSREAPEEGIGKADKIHGEDGDGLMNFTEENYRPTKVPPHPPAASSIWSFTMRADWVEGNPNLASIGTLLVAWVSLKVISVAPPERQTDTFPVSQRAPAFLAE